MRWDTRSLPGVLTAKCKLFDNRNFQKHLLFLQIRYKIHKEYQHSSKMSANKRRSDDVNNTDL